MSTVTPARPTSARPGPTRPRSAPIARAAGVDPFRVLRRHLFSLIVATFLGAVLGVVAYILFHQYYPLFSGRVLFEVQAGIAEAGQISTQQPLKDDEVARIAKTQMVLLSSRDVLMKAMRDPNVQDKTRWFARNFKDPNGAPLVQEAVDELEEDLRTRVVRGTQLFSAEWSVHDAGDVPIVLNAIARSYMDERVKIDNQVFNDNLDIFNQQMDSISRELNDLDEEIKDFIREKGIQSLDDVRYHQASIALRELTSRMQQAESARIVANSNYMQTALRIEGTLEYASEDILEAEMDYAVVAHIRTVGGLRVALRALRDQYHGDHPAVEAAERNLRAAEAEKEEKLKEVLNRNLQAKLKAYAHEMESMQQLLDQMEVEAEAYDTELRELAAQQSDFEAKRDRRDHLEEQRDATSKLIEEIKVMKVRKDAGRVRIAGLALTPRELSFPLPEVIVPLGVLIVLSLTIGFIFLRELTDQRVKSASDVAVIPGARVLGVIPDLDEDPTKCAAAELVIRKFPNSVLAESYRQACTPLAKAIDRAGHQTIVLAGGLPGAGSTTAVSNIAAVFAGAGRNVLVVDANFRRPRLASVMGLDADHAGLGDILAGEASADETIVQAEEGFAVIGAGTPATRVIERLNTGKLDSLVAELRGQFDLVLFDAPPAVVAGEAMALANKLDAAVLVVRANQEHRGLVARLIGQLADAQCELLGIMLNRPRGTAGGYFKKNFATMAAYATKPSS